MKTLLIACVSLALLLPVLANDALPVAVENKVHFTGDYVLVDKVTNRPEPRRQDAPTYPPKLRAAGIKGAVQIAYIINAQGRTEEVQVVKATDPAFAEAAVEAVGKWRFKPAKHEGKAVRVLVVHPLYFQVDP